jgi:hypothetical protein
LIYCPNPQSITKIIEPNPQANRKDLIKKGNNVYVPAPDKQNDATSRLGNALLRDYIRKSNYWNVVENEEEADFIIVYYFISRGRDQAELIMRDRFGKKLNETGFTNATDDNPHNAAKTSFEKLRQYLIFK